MKRILFIICLVLGLAGSAFARTENGITITDVNTAKANIMQCIFFDEYTPPGTNTFYYNSVNGTSSTSGAVSVPGIFTAKTVLVSVPTLGSTSITVRVEGKTRNSNEWGEIYTFGTFTAATTIESVVNVVEYVNQLRVGIKANGTKGTDTVSVTGDFISAN